MTANDTGIFWNLQMLQWKNCNEMIICLWFSLVAKSATDPFPQLTIVCKTQESSCRPSVRPRLDLCPSCPVGLLVSNVLAQLEQEWVADHFVREKT